VKSVVIGEPSGRTMEEIPFSDRGNMAIFRTRAAAEAFVREDRILARDLLRTRA
jgi:hypothetical protein